MTDIYLDNAAATKPLDSIMRNIPSWMENLYANPSSTHKAGVNAFISIERVRAEFARYIGAHPDEIYFTGSGTEANNLAVFGAVSANKRRGSKIITTDSEHDSVYRPMKELEAAGFDVVYLPTKGGILDSDLLRHEIDSKTIFVSVMHTNNETGAIYSDTGILTGGAENICVHSDAVQALGKTKIDVSKLKMNIMTFSAHKIHGLKGVGVLYLKKNTRINPRIVGGGQEKGLRASTENTLGILALGESVTELNEHGQAYNLRVKELYNYTKTKLSQFVPAAIINEPPVHSYYIMSVTLPGIRSEILLNYLSECGIYISAGSACSARRKDRTAKRVLHAYGLDEKNAGSTIRVSFSHMNTYEDIDRLIESVKKFVKEK